MFLFECPLCWSIQGGVVYVSEFDYWAKFCSLWYHESNVEDIEIEMLLFLALIHPIKIIILFFRSCLIRSQSILGHYLPEIIFAIQQFYAFQFGIWKGINIVNLIIFRQQMNSYQYDLFLCFLDVLFGTGRHDFKSQWRIIHQRKLLFVNKQYLDIKSQAHKSCACMARIQYNLKTQLGLPGNYFRCPMALQIVLWSLEICAS